MQMRFMPTAKCQHGLSLIEIIFALTLLGFLTVLVVNVLPGALALAHQSRLRAAADSLAMSSLQAARAGGYASLRVGERVYLPSVVTDGVTLWPIQEVSSQGGYDPANRLVRVSILVYWHERDTRKEVRCWGDVSNLRR